MNLRRKTRPAVAALLLALFPAITASPAHAISWQRLSLAELAATADLIVVGTAEIDGENATINVRETLKGPQVRDVVIPTLQGLFGDVGVVRDGQEAVFLLQAEAGRYSAFPPDRVQPLTRLNDVRRVLDMTRDPASFLSKAFLSDARPDEIEDLIFTLGESFASYRLESSQAPAIAKHGNRFSTRWYELVPWNSRERIAVRCAFDPAGDPKLTVEPIAPARETDLLFRHLRERLRGMANWEQVAGALPARFTVTLDARLRETAGGAPPAEPPKPPAERDGDRIAGQAVRQTTSAEAAAYLREMLRSRHPEIVLAALTALAKLRDLDAVPVVVELIKHEEERVAVAAIRYLGWARDKRATAALSAALLVVAEKYRPQPGEAARALLAIADPDSVPALHEAARRGGGWAGNALGRFGNEESFGILLQAAQDDAGQLSSAPAGMSWLVRRSNKPVEPWMNSSETWDLKGPRWKEWWAANRETFRIVRTWEEAAEP